MTSDALRRALTAPGDPPLRPLPGQVAALLETLQAPPRLAAHLRAVHDVAAQLTAAIGDRFPQLPVDRAAVLFGAATHDIGKVRHPEELSGPGSAHEPAGYDLLLRHGVAEPLARFARTHASWRGDGIGVDDLLVSVGLDRLAADADRRLAFQATHPVREPARSASDRPPPRPAPPSPDERP